MQKTRRIELKHYFKKCTLLINIIYLELHYLRIKNASNSVYGLHATQRPLSLLQDPIIEIYPTPAESSPDSNVLQ
jgi:hypothetical protein